ncbi:MAG: hypothetical protein NC184_06335 [Roseburia sp.]|nr:hypothetical protein [Roseburia sp.]
MKRKLLLVLAISVCALGCALCLTACNGDKSDNTGDDTGGEPAPTYEVTAAEWTQILSGADNFTVTGTEDGDEMTGKVVGVSVLQEMGVQQQLLTKDGEKYYGYSFDGTKWTRTSLSQSNYERRMTQAKMPAFFKDDFSAFAFADGKYTVASLDKTSTLGSTFTNVEISFKNGDLVGLKCIMQNGYETIDYVIGNVGATEIEMPTSYTSVIQGMYNMVVEGETGWTLADDLGIEFTTDGTCHMESAGTYQIANDIITMSFDDGNTYYATVDGKILWLFESKADAADIANSIQPFYNGDEIDAGDRAKIVALFGDGAY